MAYFFVFLVACAVGWYALVSRQTSRARLPPGPKPLPIIGNLFDLPKQKPWVTFVEWSRKYGSDILFVDIPHQPMIILNSFQAAYEIMEKRSRNYVDKPTVITDELTGWDFALSLMPYGARWRAIRRAFHQYFNQGAMKQYHETVTREVRVFLQRACEPGEVGRIDLKSVKRTFASIILDITYGMRIQDEKNEFIKLSSQAIEAVNITRAQVFWVNYFPWLTYIPSWIPGPYANALAFARRYGPIVNESRARGFNAVIKAFAEGTANPSMAQKLIQGLEDKVAGTEAYAMQKEVSIDATGMAYSASVDTQTSTISSFFIAMAMFPHVQRKAQRELDSVVGPDRLPTAGDMAALPYIQAIFLEALRWMPALPLNVPHRASEDDEYMGFLIPRGHSVMINIWAVLHDPVEYPDPETFNPDRFMRDGALNPDVREPTIAFGSGRRICGGRHLVKESLSLMMASVLHVFNVEHAPAEDEHLTMEGTCGRSGLIVQPESVPCCLKPRNAAALTLVQNCQ